MFIKSENTSKGFVIWYLQRDVDNHMHDVNLFNHERILSKVKKLPKKDPKKYKKAGGKNQDLLKDRLHYKIF